MAEKNKFNDTIDDLFERSRPTLEGMDNPLKIMHGSRIGYVEGPPRKLTAEMLERHGASLELMNVQEEVAEAFRKRRETHRKFEVIRLLFEYFRYRS